jgi:gamma-glutamyltranspeptidase/glutathione hydrolase
MRKDWYTPAGILCVCGLLLCCFVACSGVKVTKHYERGAVATAAPIASQIGLEIFRQGGNAYDAAVAIGFALAVVYPEAGNIGGGGFAVIRDGRTGAIRALDFRETAPALAEETMFLDDTGGVIAGASTFGARAAGVPGTVAGLHALWSSYGSLDWDGLVRIAADLADSGFVVDGQLAGRLADTASQLDRFEETATIFRPGGQAVREGDRLVQSDLARTLYKIAAEGPDGFYRGAVAGLIDSCMKKHGGLITLDDLDDYKVRWREPVRFTFDSLEIYSMCPPSSGGIVLGQMLGMLQGSDFSAMFPGSPEYIQLFVEAARLAYADRSVHLGDPAFYDIPGLLLDPDYVAEQRARMPKGEAGNSEQTGPGNPLRYESPETTHYSVCDGDGNMVALTYTLNTRFGSKLTVDGAGFLLNNEMDDFAIKPGHPNSYGLVGADANKVEPGKRMLSSMTPTLVLNNGQPFLILGTPGGSRIITTVAQVLVNYTRFGLSLEDAVAYPRVHHQWLPDQVYLEKPGFDVATIQALIRMGYDVKEIDPYCDVQAIEINALGLMHPVADPRRGGTALGE